MLIRLLRSDMLESDAPTECSRESRTCKCQKLQRAGFNDQMEVDMAGAGFEVAIVQAP